VRHSINDHQLQVAAERFRLLGEPMRLRILRALQDGEQSVGAIVARTGASQPNVSRHLKELADGGIVARRRDGNTIYYRIADEMVFRLCDLVCRSAARQAAAHLSALGRPQPGRKERHA
jgi:DNA-binding transcriptional ArsR family regulator